MSSRVPKKHGNAAAAAGSGLLHPHDRDYALGNGTIRWIGRVLSKRLVVIIDLEKDPVSVRIERAKVVLFVRVVGVTKVVEHCDGLDDPFDGLGAERRHTWCDDRHSAGEMLAQLVVQRADARSLRVHDWTSRL